MADRSVPERICEIYGWVSPYTKKVVYVGKTSVGINVRMWSHRAQARRKPKSTAHRWLRRQLGWGHQIQAVKLAACTVAESSAIERAWIEKLGGPGKLLNERVGGNGNPGIGRVDWTPEALSLLGTMSDAKLAKLLMCNQGTVSYRRRVHGIPRRMQDLPASTFHPTAEQIAQLGLRPDYVVAAEWGVSKFVVVKHRRRRGIVPYALSTGQNGRISAGQPHRRWKKKPMRAPADMLAKLGRVKDYELADRYGFSLQHVGKLRRERNIRPIRAAKGEVPAALKSPSRQ